MFTMCQAVDVPVHAYVALTAFSTPSDVCIRLLSPSAVWRRSRVKGWSQRPCSRFWRCRRSSTLRQYINGCASNGRGSHNQISDTDRSDDSRTKLGDSATAGVNSFQPEDNFDQQSFPEDSTSSSSMRSEFNSKSTRFGGIFEPDAQTLGRSSESSGNDSVPSRYSSPELNRMKPWWRRLLEDAEFDDVRTVGVSFLVAVLIRGFVVEPRFIPSESMLPTFEIGDQLVVEKVSKYARHFQAGEVVVFKPPPALLARGYSKKDAFIKRVVGTAGDTVSIRHGHVELNGVAQPEPYIYELPRYDWGPQTIPPGFVMVLGDNRNNSYDSHLWGFLPTSNIIGRAVARYWPPKRIGLTYLWSADKQLPPPPRPDVSVLQQGAPGD